MSAGVRGGALAPLLVALAALAGSCTDVATGASVTYSADSISSWIFRISSRMTRYCT